MRVPADAGPPNAVHSGDIFLSRGKTPIYCTEKCQRRAQNVRRHGKKHFFCVICGTVGSSRDGCLSPTGHRQRAAIDRDDAAAIK
jgi:hypothetical protein